MMETAATYTLGELNQFINTKNGREPKKERPKKTVWKVFYLGKEQFEGTYPNCVAFKNQFKGQKDYTKYVIK